MVAVFCSVASVRVPPTPVADVPVVLPPWSRTRGRPITPGAEAVPHGAAPLQHGVVIAEAEGPSPSQPVDALNLRVRVKEWLECLRLPCMWRKAFDAEAHLERQEARLCIRPSCSGEEVCFGTVEVDSPGMFNGEEAQPWVGEEDEVAVWPKA